MKYISDYGKMLDTIQSFVLQFSPDYDEQVQGALSQNKYGIEWVDENCDKPDEALVIFFRVPLQKTHSLVEIMFGNEGDDMIGASINVYIDNVFNKEQIIDYMTEYYFFCKYEDITLTEIRNLLDKSNYSNEMKYHLLSFYVDTDKYITLLQHHMMMRYRLVERHYENNEAVLASIRDELSDEIFANMDQDLWNVITKYNQIYYSVCLINNYKMERRGLGATANGENVCFTVGMHWKEQMFLASRANKIDISLFGKIISEPNRMKIINYLLDHEEITIAQAVEYLGASVTATTYHLNMMYGAKMLKPRYEGRKIFYSLQRDYFEVAIGMLRDLADRM